MVAVIPAHPRSRGENLRRHSDPVRRAGSSPLTRGKPEDRRERRILRRLIPAHAGKTRNGASPASHAWAHPRSRGENVLRCAHDYHPPGSSPLTRGKPADAGQGRADPGLIPAHAGKTSPALARTSSTVAHPRSRGENPGSLGTGIVGAGSSPLTRGKPRRAWRLGLSTRLIPAHAGKTDLATRCHFRHEAHPRSRGENTYQNVTDAATDGSSPLTRGKPKPIDAAHEDMGLIPAHAGKTSSVSVPTSAATAHPRSRGENHGLVTSAVTWIGSSPLTRGKRPTRPTSSLTTRLIPAHAGKTGQCRASGSASPAHPRSRGENLKT